MSSDEFFLKHALMSITKLSPIALAKWAPFIALNFCCLGMVFCPKTGSLAFTPPGDEMSEVVSRRLPTRQLWVSNLSKVATQWLEVDSNQQPFGCKSKNV